MRTAIQQKSFQLIKKHCLLLKGGTCGGKLDCLKQHSATTWSYLHSDKSQVQARSVQGLPSTHRRPPITVCRSSERGCFIDADGKPAVTYASFRFRRIIRINVKETDLSNSTIKNNSRIVSSVVVKMLVSISFLATRIINNR